MKICNTCHIEKSYSEFSRDKYRKDGLQGKCKSCMKISNRKFHNDNPEYYIINKDIKSQYNQNYHLSKTLPYWVVYMLPNANDYVGHTNNPFFRMLSHKRLKRDTTGWIELHRFDTREEALAKEAEYHKMGYPGINDNYIKIKNE